MRILKTYYQYIKEEFTDANAISNRLQSLLLGKVKLIKTWFQPEGALKNVELTDIDITNYTKSLNKNLIFSFISNEFHYQVIITFKMTDYKEGSIGKCFLKIKKYSYDDVEHSLEGILIDEWDSSNLDNSEDGKINIEDISPEFILDKISKMDEEPQAFGSKEKSKSEESSTPAENATQIGSTPDQGSPTQGTQTATRESPPSENEF